MPFWKTLLTALKAQLFIAILVTLALVFVKLAFHPLLIWVFKGV